MKTDQLLDVFPKRPNQKIAKTSEVLQTGRSTRSSKSNTLYTFCPYANKIVEYGSEQAKPNEESSCPDQSNGPLPRKSPSPTVAPKQRKRISAVPESAKNQIHVDNENIPLDSNFHVASKRSRSSARVLASSQNTSELASIDHTPRKSTDSLPKIEKNSEQVNKVSQKIPTSSATPKSKATVSSVSDSTPQQSPELVLYTSAFNPKQPARKRTSMIESAPPKIKKQKAETLKTTKINFKRQIAAVGEETIRCSKSKKPNLNAVSLLNPTSGRKMSQPGPNHKSKPPPSVMINPVFTSYSPMRPYVPFIPKLARDDETVLRDLETAKKGKQIKEEVEAEQLEPVYEDIRPAESLGFIAMESENLDIAPACRLMKNLACFQDKHENLLIPILQLADRDVLDKLDESNVESFYKNEFVEAIENFEKYQKSPELFYDINYGKYESYEENGMIIEHPLPSRPEIFPIQIRNRDALKIEEVMDSESEPPAQQEEEQNTFLTELANIIRKMLKLREFLGYYRLAYAHYYEGNPRHPSVNIHHDPHFVGFMLASELDISNPLDYEDGIEEPRELFGERDPTMLFYYLNSQNPEWFDNAYMRYLQKYPQNTNTDPQ
uniref:Myb-like domain-containing protein n=1 Tax=Caenorhabditis tropicalis TaxID=1561998 RepID=A0A1I7UNC6_9PELO